MSTYYCVHCGMADKMDTVGRCGRCGKTAPVSTIYRYPDADTNTITLSPVAAAVAGAILDGPFPPALQAFAERPGVTLDMLAAWCEGWAAASAEAEATD